MDERISKATAEGKTSIGDEDSDDAPLKDIKDIVEAFRGLYDRAYGAYLPLVDDICSRNAPKGEVECLLDYLLDFAGEDRMLFLYKRVCRKYFHRYPEMVANHICMWRDVYDEDYGER